MTHTRVAGLFAIWMLTVVLAGGIMMSFHQPFRPPDDRILKLADNPVNPGWRALHVLSGSCSCSQGIMQHLLELHTVDGISEQIIFIDGPEPYLAESSGLLDHLHHQGFSVKHIAEANVPLDSGLGGVPLLVVTSPSGQVVYAGGYGSSSAQDSSLLQQIRFGHPPKALPVVGCAIGSRLRRQIDPFHLKY